MQGHMYIINNNILTQKCLHRYKWILPISISDFKKKNTERTLLFTGDDIFHKLGVSTEKN